MTTGDGTSGFVRQRTPEIMDGPDLPLVEHRSALDALARVNALSRVSHRIWREIAPLATGNRPLRVLDLASGGGDVLLGVAQRAVAARVPAEFIGLDISSAAVDMARGHAARAGSPPSDVRLDYRVANVIDDPLPEGFDVVMSSLFMHHLDEATAVSLLERMRAAAGRKALVDDLIRSRAGYWLTQVACRVLTRSYIARVDGPVSARAAFTLSEARAMAERAGLTGARLTRHWPLRFFLVWDRR